MYGLILPPQGYCPIEAICAAAKWNSLSVVWVCVTKWSRILPLRFCIGLPSGRKLGVLSNKTIGPYVQLPLY